MNDPVKNYAGKLEGTSIYYGKGNPDFFNDLDSIVYINGDCGLKKNRIMQDAYTITWKNEDGSIIDTTKVEQGKIPTHADPAKQSSGGYEYTFAGWKPKIVAATKDTVYTATFNVHKYAREEDVPEHTIFVITTDGMENASHRYNSEEVKRMVKRQKEKYGWEFLFLGANIDAVETAAHFGIMEDRAVTFHNDARGQQLNYEVLSKTVSSFRACAPVGRE